MKILITGANGFVGKHLCMHLLKSNYTIYALVRNKRKFDINHMNLHVIEGTLENLNWLNDLPHDLDSIIHTAGIVHSYDNNDFYRINTYLTEKLFTSLLNINNQIKIIFISSLAACGPSLGTSLRNEQDICFPVSDYGRSKKLAEDALKKMTHNYVIIRPPTVIGPGDQAFLAIFKMVKYKIIILPGINSRNKNYSFVSVFDLIINIEKTISKEVQGVYFISNPEVVKFDDIIKSIKKYFKYKVLFYIPVPLIITKLISKILAIIFIFKNHKSRLTPDKYHELAANNFTCDSSKSIELIKARYDYTMDDIIRITFEDYKKRNWL